MARLRVDDVNSRRLREFPECSMVSRYERSTALIDGFGIPMVQVNGEVLSDVSSDAMPSSESVVLPTV